MKHAPILHPKVHRIRRSRAEMARLVEDFRASGSTQSAYARSRGLSVSTLNYWVRHTPSQESRQVTQRLVRVKVTEGPGALSSQPLRCFELVFPGGLRLSIPPDFEQGALAGLLELLNERC